MVKHKLPTKRHYLITSAKKLTTVSTTTKPGAIV